MDTETRHIRSNWQNRERWDHNPVVQDIGDKLSDRHIEPDALLPIIENLLSVYHALMRKCVQRQLRQVGRMHVAHVIGQQMKDEAVVQVSWREVVD